MSTTPMQTVQTIPTASQLFRQAAGIQPKGNPLGEPATCAMCGAHLNAGDLAHKLADDTFSDSFNNKLDMHVPGTVLCGDCVALWSKEFLQSYSKSYASPAGVFKLASNEDVQAFLLTPPVAPFAAIFNTRQQQHMIWRTPVCLNHVVLIVRVDDEVLQIRRQLALDGARAWQIVERCQKAIGSRGMPAWINRDLEGCRMGAIRPDVIKAVSAYSEEGAAAIRVLQRLRMAEWWALCALRYIDQDAPETWPKPVKILPLPGVIKPVIAVFTEQVDHA